MKLFLIKNTEMNDKELALLAILNGMYCSKHDNKLTTSVSLIGYNMTGRFMNKSEKRDRTILENIRDGIRSLSYSGIIEILDNCGDEYVFSNKGLEVDTNKEFFVVVDQEEMQTIFSNANKPFNVFGFFTKIVGTINNVKKSYHMSQDQMVSSWGYGKETVVSYLNQLEEMKLLYVHRPKKRYKDGSFQNLNNSYGRYADRKLVIEEASNYMADKDLEDISHNMDRTAIKLRYNAYCKGAKKYQNNPELVEHLRKECIAYNKSLAKNPIEVLGEDGNYKNRSPLDMSVFPNFTTTSVEEDEDIWGDDYKDEYDDTWDLY